MIISISNQKGGVGKTTTVLNLSVSLAQKGKSVLIIDIDPQANLTSGIGISKEKDNPFKTTYDILVNGVEAQAAIKPTRFENLDIIPSSIELAAAEIEMVNKMSRETILQRALLPFKDKYDFIFIDCPPSLGILTVNAHVASDKVFIPVQAEYFALEGLGQLINTIKLIRSSLNAELEIGGVIITMFDTRTNLSKDIAKELKGFFDEKIFDTIIPRNIRLSEAPSHGLSIQEYDPESKGSIAYERLTEEILKRFS